MKHMDRLWAGAALFVTFLAVFAARVFVPALAKDETINGLLDGLEQGGVLAIIGFYYGSSKKDEPPPSAPQ